LAERKSALVAATNERGFWDRRADALRTLDELHRVEGLLADLLPGGGAPPPQTAEELASRLRDALATNTIGGRAAVEAKWHSASSEVESAQAAWKRIGPVPGAEGRDLAARFERACRRFFEERPKPTKTEWADRPRGERSERGERGGRGPRPRFDRPDRR